MFRVPDYYRDVSRSLFQVMDDIGVNPRIANLRRRTKLLGQTMKNLTNNVLGRDSTCYILGSQSEGTTTIGLDSDTDVLICLKVNNVITDWGDWVQGKNNYLMIQDETTPPGYCKLQILKGDIPVPVENNSLGLYDRYKQHMEYDQERVLLKNNISEMLLRGQRVQNGPAITDISTNIDCVLAYLICTKRAVSGIEWLERYSPMIKTALEEECFIVPTGHPNSTTECVEWRISTCMAEKVMMHSMNITQLKCYVLLKMIVKSFIKQEYPDTISSYHCKTVFMHCIERFPNDLWREEKLLLCVTTCLQFLYNCVISNTCPHYFFHMNNLFEGRIDYRTRKKLALVLKHILCSNGNFLLEIKIDNIGQRLFLKLSPLLSNGMHNRLNMRDVLSHYNTIFGLNIEMFYWMIARLKQIGILCSTDIHLFNEALDTLVLYAARDSVHQLAVELMIPSLCTTMATCIASNCIRDGQQLSGRALSFFAMGIDSDVSSGRLKLASALFCSGDTERTELVLRNIEARYNPDTVEPICGCRSTRFMSQIQILPFDILRNDNLSLMRPYVAFEVEYTRGEMYCVPPGLQYEMFRCTSENAVVDSLPYLYYLQYLTYGRLGRHPEQQRALDNLINTIRDGPGLYHRDTALNLLGQCMELRQGIGCSALLQTVSD